MITRHDLKELQALTKVPALSILLPTHRTSPDNKQDPILVKNLVADAKDRLSKEFSARDLEPLLKKLDELVADIDYTYALDGLALFVAHDFAKKFYLPFTVPQRVIIGQSFATRDLVYGLHRAQRYWVFLLSQNASRLLAGTGDTLEEVYNKDFPLQMEGPGATTALPDSADSAYMDDRHRRFFQSVDRAFTDYAEDDTLPIVVGGVVRQISFFQEVSQYKSQIVGTLSSNFDKATVSELVPEVWPFIQAVRSQQRADALAALDTAIGEKKVSTALQEIWQLANEGRGKLLLVESGYHVPGVVDDKGGLQIVEAKGGTEVMDDAIDEIIEAVLAKGGEVMLMEDGSLADHHGIVLTLRY
ncbi:hypothetical protein IQ273_09510 [Nodosilinea sp. LEGE 07298]|uniref:AOC03_06830 family ribosome hibernation factor n=1 Tax=Nodosilinea sp. LEGE 07298 TaxID=2777970 RepID=UPI00187E4910|nr:hypothetical protein [Nodosilinea sp. LEGE 07298]MBE9109651.1 hypothetical protein [Nodosilinea sp. LEGE 07298]